MSSVPIIALLIPIVAIVCGTLIIIAKIIKGVPLEEKMHKKRRSSDSSASEEHLLHEIHEGLNRMETRIEALESIILEDEPPRKKIK